MFGAVPNKVRSWVSLQIFMRGQKTIIGYLKVELIQDCYPGQDDLGSQIWTKQKGSHELESPE